MFSVTFRGFKTETEARAFIDWYEGSGEQDAYDCMKNADVPTLVDFNDPNWPPIRGENNLTITLK